jgi:hypothetical protein
LASIEKIIEPLLIFLAARPRAISSSRCTNGSKPQEFRSSIGRKSICAEVVRRLKKRFRSALISAAQKSVPFGMNVDPFDLYNRFRRSDRDGQWAEFARIAHGLERYHSPGNQMLELAKQAP